MNADIYLSFSAIWFAVCKMAVYIVRPSNSNNVIIQVQAASEFLEAVSDGPVEVALILC